MRGRHDTQPEYLPVTSDSLRRLQLALEAQITAAGAAGVTQFNGRAGNVSLVLEDVRIALGTTYSTNAGRALVVNPTENGFSLAADVVSNGDKGDITVSASGLTWTIDAGVVTPAKMADVATATVFYRKTALAGAPEVQTLATLKTDLGLTGTNTGDQTTVTGNAGSATILQTARAFSITGGGITAAAVNFDGSAVVALNASVDAGHITLARMANINSASFIGRVTAAAGVPENITGTQATALLDPATTTLKGLMSSADKSKLDGVATGATANATDAALRDRATHTGTQANTTITGLGTASTQNTGTSGATIPLLNGANTWGANQLFTGSVLSNSPTAGIGYAAGAGGAVTQATNKTTTVTLNKVCGIITMNAASLAAGAVATFAVNNSAVVASDTIVLNLSGGITSGQNYRYWIAGVDAGVLFVTLENRSTGALAEAVRFNFSVIKTVTS